MVPDFDLTSTAYTIADYCSMVHRGEIRVNRDYQRSDKVWPHAAKSFLIETILLGYPVPKLSLHQITDVKTRRTVKEIVDGQQRTLTIKAFFDNRLRLSKTLELQDAAGRNYEELPEDTQHNFLNYGVSVDIFTGAKPDQIREVFRRINSYNVPLNPEEQRHAIYQGNMKWFIYELSRNYDAAMLTVGTFTQGRLVRMQDAKLYAEIVHALLNGLQTTRKQQLDVLYKIHDEQFAHAVRINTRIQRAMDMVLLMEDLHHGPLMRAHMLYSLVLAITHVQDPLDVFQSIVGVEGPTEVDPGGVLPALSELAVALDDGVGCERLKKFIDASATRTNVKSQREERFRWLVNALR